MVMDSGAIKTIVPNNTVPNMTIKETKDTGRNFRAANGGLIPNEGETTIKGKSELGNKIKMKAQVAAVTKPLASASEVVDANDWIILHKKGGMIKPVSPELAKKIKKTAGRIRRQHGTNQERRKSVCD